MKIAQERKQRYFSKRQEEHHCHEVPRTEANHWSKRSGFYSKEKMPALVTTKELGRWDTNAQKMERHLKYSSLS